MNYNSMIGIAQESLTYAECIKKIKKIYGIKGLEQLDKTIKNKGYTKKTYCFYSIKQQALLNKNKKRNIINKNTTETESKPLITPILIPITFKSTRTGTEYKIHNIEAGGINNIYVNVIKNTEISNYTKENLIDFRDEIEELINLLEAKENEQL